MHRSSVHSRVEGATNVDLINRFEVAAANEADITNGWGFRMHSECAHSEPCAPFALPIGAHEARGKMVTESTYIYHFRSLFQTLLKYDSEVMKTRIKCEGFQEHTDFGDNTSVVAGPNNRLKARETKFNN